ncbi:uncharacterized protein N7511_006394 [Penicillium nucicola]|uniref:uncharacterized protein n=1 Tax=Penicillium nucicola TaxID=1850975 RepID=UPI0025458462|nr:uncharacterized protein N7511_006394 [Penicillium nucicola]KAJ5757700.1 hypothetical protein N7511_006394 [Penicillium nucicola]
MEQIHPLTGEEDKNASQFINVNAILSEKAPEVTHNVRYTESLTANSEETKFIDGHPVIETGVHVSQYLISLRDDEDPPVTFRSILLGSMFTALASVIQMLYLFKPVGVDVSQVFLQLMIFICGGAWAVFTPSPSRLKWKWLRSVLQFLNFGQPFTIKEHVIASMIAGSANNGLSGVEVYAVERLLYNRTVSATTAIFATFSIALCGFTMAGIMRPLLVYPSEMVYWGTLPQVILFQQLHFDRAVNRQRLTKFGWTLMGSAIWEIFPSYVVTWLTGLSIFCLASMKAPADIRSLFTKLFGGASSNEGMGFLNFSLDWQYIGSGSMALPLRQQLNSWLGNLIWYPAWLGLWYSNTWSAKTFPFMSTSLFRENGTVLHTMSILNEDGIIDSKKLQDTSLPFLSSSAVWVFFCSNMAIGALIIHVSIFLSKDMLIAWMHGRTKTQPDPHYQAMKKYKETPMWWYLILFVLCFVAGVVANAKGETTLPVWGFIVALALGAFICPFSLFLFAFYGNGISTNQISKMVAGAIHPGRPLANLYFASWSHQVISIANAVSTWLKVGQYLKVPTRSMFFLQIYGSLLGACINYVVMTTIVTSKREILVDPIGNNIWSGIAIQGLNSQAVTWALAKEMYSINGRYYIVPLGLLIGACLPVLHWGISRVFPRTKKWPINTAIIIASASGQFGITSNVTSSIVVGMIAQLWIRPRIPHIFNKYNYLIGAALDGGSQFMTFILAFAVFGAAGTPRPFPTWWGNPKGPPDHCQ